MSEDTTHETPATSSGLDALRARLVRAKREKAAIESSMSDADREEMALRRELAAAEEEAKNADLERRELCLERQLELVREEHPDWLLSSLLIEEYDHSFILRANHRAYEQWSEQIAKSANNKKIDRAAEHRRFAAACVVDWNGDDVIADISHRAGELVTFLKNNAGIVDAIVNAGARLTGAFNRARKS